MEQQRRISPPQLPATSPASSSPLSGINEDLYELLQSTTTTRTPTCFPDVAHIPKMEPELGDFMGSSSYTTWGAAQLGATHLGTQLYNSNNSVMDNSSSLTCLTNFIQQGTQQLPDIATQFATYTPPPAASAGSGAQIQALRDFMVYGNMVPTMAPSPPFSSSAMSSRATTPVAANGAALGFYHQLDEVDGMQHVVATSIGSSSCIPMPSLAYRALCSEIYASTTERSPHRSQFQRENHILAERQRREEMNEKFSALRAMIPKATKKDKASIVGDTIDYVLELEKRLKQLQACKDTASGGGVFVNKAGSLKRKSPYGSRCEDGVMGGGGGSSSETTNAREVNVNVSAAESPVREAHSAASSPSDQITAESKPVCLVCEISSHTSVGQI